MRYLRLRKERLLGLVALLMVISAIPASVVAPRAALAQSGDESIPEEEIVYIGEDERIYVLDTHQIDDGAPFSWVSPDADWRSVDVGDFNNDGDMEIVAVGGGKIEEEDDTNEDGVLVVYDPFVRTGQPGGWAELYRIIVPGKPEIVKAGNFDDGIEGDEILYGFKMHDDVKQNPDDLFRINVIKSGSSTPDGTYWVEHIAPKDDGNAWTYVESGDLGDGGPDEVGLIDEDGGEVSIYRLTDGWRQRIYSDSSSNDPYRAVAFGDFYQGGYNEVFISRNATPSLFYFQYFPGDENELQEVGHEPLSPYPRFLFMGDVNGSGDDELFLLRRDEEPRLFSRNDGADYMPLLEDPLDEDNGYRAGAAGDLDGDGDAEVVIIRDDKVRVYENLQNRWGIEEYTVRAETKILRTGDVDGVGAGAQFAFSAEKIEQALELDQQIQNRLYTLTNDGTDDVINFTYAVTDAPSWVTVNVPNLQASAADPAEVYVSFDSTGLSLGDYAAELVFTATSPATSNSPFSVPIVLTVQEAQITPNPESVWFMYRGCEAGLDPTTQILEIGGSDGVRYNAAIVDRPLLQAAQQTLDGEIYAAFMSNGSLALEDNAGNRATVELPEYAEVSATAVTSTTWPSGASWVSATSATSQVPDEITLVATPTEAPQGLVQAVLVLVGDEQAGSAPTNVRIVPLNLICIVSDNYLPLIDQ